MPDNVSITAGAGTTISTEEVTTLNGGAVSAQHVQRVVPAARTADGTAVDLGTPHDAAAAAVPPLLIGGYSSVGAPTGVSADGDAVRAWCLPSGARVVTLYGGNGFVSDTNGVYGQGNVPHDNADAGFPTKVGARAVTSLDDATMVAAGDRTDLYADLDGVLITKHFCPDADTIVERVSNTDGAATALANFGATANARNCVTAVSGYNDSTANVFVDIRDGTAGTVIWTFALPAKGGFNMTFPKPLRQPTANTALAYDVSAATTTVYLSFLGFKSKA